MKLRITVAVLCVLALALPVIATATRFPDVPADHPRHDDIEFVVEQGWFVGRVNGSFSPGARITPSQIATVIERAFPEGMTRAEFASFLRGGNWRVGDGAPEPTTTTSVPVNFWSRTGITSCAVLYDKMLAWSVDNYSWNPDEYSSDSDTDGYDRFRTFQDIEIIRVSDWYNRFTTPTFYMCEGNAKLETGNKLKMFIWGNLDADRDDFYYYWFPSTDRPSCRTAKNNGSTLYSYNVSYYYGSSNDSDGDGVMCENILPEHTLKIIGNPITGV